MKKSLLFLLMLIGCVPHYADYQPTLNKQPKDLVKYDLDRKFCLADANSRKNNSTWGQDDFTKFPREMVDECMTKKGYDVVKVERHGFINFN